MRTFAKVTAWVVATLVVLAAALFLYLRNANLEVYKAQIERVLSAAIGLDVEFDGPFELHVGRISTITAENVILANPAWPEDPQLLRIGRLSLAVNTWSLISGPAVIDDISVNAAELKVSRDEYGATNWSAGRPPGEDESSGGFDSNRLVVAQARLIDLHVAVADPGLQGPLDLDIQSLTLDPDDRGMLYLDLAGAVNAIPLAATGRVGSLDGLVSGDKVSANVELSLGRLSLMLDGEVDNLQRLRGADVSLSVKGPAIEKVTDTLALPTIATGPFDVVARITRGQAGNAVHLEGDVGSISLFVDGDVDEFLAPQSIDLEYRFASPQSAYIAVLFGVDDPQRAAFDVRGTVRKQRNRLELVDTEVALGRGEVRVDGWFEPTGGIPDMDLKFSASGPDLSVFNVFIGRKGLPARPFDIGGHVEKARGGWRFENAHAKVGDITIDARGELSEKGAPGNRIDLRAAGPDVSVLRELTGIAGLPEKPFDVAVTLRSEKGGIGIEKATGTFGDNRAEVSGFFNPDDRFVGTDLHLAAHGNDLVNISFLKSVPNLPAGRYDLGAQVTVDKRRVNFKGIKASVGDLNATADGYLVRDTSAPELAVNLTAAGSNIASGIPYLPFTRLPGEAYRLEGGLKLEGSTLELRDMRFSVGGLQLSVSGNADVSHGIAGTADLEIGASAPDGNVLRVLANRDYLPPGPFSLRGNLQVTRDLIRMSAGEAALGGYGLSAEGAVSRSRPYSGNNIRVSARGPEFQSIGRIFGYEGLSTLPFTLAIALDGTENGFQTDDIRISVGASEVHGTMSADLSGDKPIIKANFASTLVDLRHAQQAIKKRETDAAGTSAATPASSRHRMFSAAPLSLAWLDTAKIDVDLRADTLRLQHGDLGDLTIVAKLDDGQLTVNPVSYVQGDGGLDATLNVSPAGDAYTVTIAATVENNRPLFLAADGQDPSTIPPVHAEFEFRGTGRSIAEIAGESNGYLFMFQDKGQVAVLGLQLITGDLVTGLMEAINPLAKRRDYTNVKCGIFDIDIVNGVATAKTIAIQTDAVQVFVSGDLKLADEKLNLSIRTKPREGLGVSVGGVVNAFIRVGGTLSKPSIEIDPARSVTTTGVAVATGGISLLARSLFDRLSAEADMCPKLPRSRKAQ